MQCDEQTETGLLLTIMGIFACPFFKSSGDAMIARSRDNGMECFRPVAFDACALEQLRKTDGNTASFLVVADPSRKLKHGLHATFTELAVNGRLCKRIPEH